MPPLADPSEQSRPRYGEKNRMYTLPAEGSVKLNDRPAPAAPLADSSGLGGGLLDELAVLEAANVGPGMPWAPMNPRGPRAPVSPRGPRWFHAIAVRLLPHLAPGFASVSWPVFP